MLPRRHAQGPRRRAHVRLPVSQTEVRSREHDSYREILPDKCLAMQHSRDFPFHDFAGRNRGSGSRGNGNKLPTLSWPLAPTIMRELTCPKPPRDGAAEALSLAAPTIVASIATTKHRNDALAQCLIVCSYA
jgi:hypothetical protein